MRRLSGSRAARTAARYVIGTRHLGKQAGQQPGGPEGVGSLLQGYIEQSNVSVVQEFVNLIVAQRGYEANSKVVQAADQMYQDVNNLSRS